MRLCILALVSLSIYGQSWSGILPSTRAIDWTHAGLPPTLPDGETTANPWTPPARTQCGSTVNPSGNTTTDTTNINTALAACTSGHYVLLGSGDFTVNGRMAMHDQNGVTLRGGGAQATKVTLASGGFFAFGSIVGSGTCTWSSGFSVGTTSITLTSCSAAPQVGLVTYLSQCNTGLSGQDCGTGTQADNGSIWVCGGVDNLCQRPGQGTTNVRAQTQAVYVTSVVNNSGTYTVTISNGLRMANWSSGSGTQANWFTGPHTVTPYGNALEDMTIYNSGNGLNESVEFRETYASWIKGVRFIGSGAVTPLLMLSTKNSLISNNYIFSDPAIDAAYPPGIQQGVDSDDLVINNISASSVAWEGGGSKEGDVIAYNYTRDTFTAYALDLFEHSSGNAFTLYEGNQTPTINEDNTHGTHNLSTAFRNYLPGFETPYTGGANPAGITFGSWDRFTNSIGNVIGTSSIGYTYQNTNPASAGGSIWSIGYGGGFGDSLSLTSSMRWGNYDTFTGAVRWCGDSGSPGWSTTCGSTSEIPASLSSPNVALSNPVPSTTTLPASFFLPTVAHAAGGTGLNWWKVCTAWASFPTTCSASSIKPFPTAGPDVTGGAYNAGHAHDTPAALAWLNLPVDTTYQSSYTITSSSWSGGIETLTISGLPDVTHLLGPFQLSGANAACLTGATINASNEVLITNSSSTTVSYALAVNPSLSCTGTFKFPDVRQFDESVYQTDSGFGSSVAGKAVIRGAIIQ